MINERAASEQIRERFLPLACGYFECLHMNLIKIL